MRKVWWFLVVMAATYPSAAQVVKAPESWDKLAAKADEVVKVDLDRKMLQFASRFMDNEGDAEGKQIISKLNGVYVRSLEFKHPGAYTEADVEPVRAQLLGPEWSRIVQVDSKTDKEKVDVYLKTVNNQTMGIVILSQEPSELTLVTLDGPINPEDLDSLSGNFGVPKGLSVRKDKASKSTPPVKK